MHIILGTSRHQRSDRRDGMIRKHLQLFKFWEPEMEGKVTRPFPDGICSAPASCRQVADDVYLHYMSTSDDWKIPADEMDWARRLLNAAEETDAISRDLDHALSTFETNGFVKEVVIAAIQRKMQQTVHCWELLEGFVCGQVIPALLQADLSPSEAAACAQTHRCYRLLRRRASMAQSSLNDLATCVEARPIDHTDSTSSDKRGLRTLYLLRLSKANCDVMQTSAIATVQHEAACILLLVRKYFTQGQWDQMLWRPFTAVWDLSHDLNLPCGPHSG
mmetsp:Transcript_19244/g.53662  ORF Transcript_19244/g.53662 Transcript_19244/m.53662 type:complete len:276 (+) Transcript_19244:145-972(+)